MKQRCCDVIVESLDDDRMSDCDPRMADKIDPLTGLFDALAVNEALLKLPIKQQNVLKLIYYYGCTIEESADVMQISQVSVVKLRNKGLEEMRVLLEDEL